MAGVHDADFERSQPAPHLRRAIAWVVDFALVMVVVTRLPQPFPYALPVALVAAYHGLCVWLTKQTLGKALMGLKVRRLGKPPGLIWSLGRSSLGYFGVDLLGLGLLLALVDRRHRALHDQLWRSEVVVVEGGRIDLKSLASRTMEFGELHAAALRKRKGALAALGIMVAWLLGMAKVIGKVLGFVWQAGGGSSYSGGAPSIFETLSLKAKVLLVTGTTAASVAVATAVPPFGDAVKWVLEPRYYFGRPAPPGALVGTWRTQQFAQIYNEHIVGTSPLPVETWRIAISGDGYRLTIGSERVKLSRVTPVQYAGEGQPSRDNCVSEDTGRLIERDGYGVRNFYRVISGARRPTFEIETYGRANTRAIARNCWKTTTAIYGAIGARIR